jgi:hypothetical protein
MQGKLKLAPHYPDRNGDNPWKAYLEDLNAMRSDDDRDWRPFDEPFHFSELSEDVLVLLVRLVNLGIVPEWVSGDEAGHVWSSPPYQTEYQVYPGGPLYTIPSLGGTLEKTTWEPDPAANPLGIYRRSGTLDVNDDVTVRGSVFCTGDVRIKRDNVRFEPVELPGLDGSDTPIRLPAAYCEDFIVEDGGGGAVEGLICAYDEMRIEKSPDTTKFSVTGRAIVSKMHVKERQPWEDADWKDLYSEFKAQSSVKYFPVWMARLGYDPRPRITFTPDEETVTYHWKDPRDPVYTPHPDDLDDGVGLRWDLIQWIDGS